MSYFLKIEENERKRQQEANQQRVATQMAELKMAKIELEQEVDTHKKRLRLHMEAQVRTNTEQHLGMLHFLLRRHDLFMFFGICLRARQALILDLLFSTVQWPFQKILMSTLSQVFLYLHSYQ